MRENPPPRVLAGHRHTHVMRYYYHYYQYYYLLLLFSPLISHHAREPPPRVLAGHRHGRLQLQRRRRSPGTHEPKALPPPRHLPKRRRAIITRAVTITVTNVATAPHRVAAVTAPLAVATVTTVTVIVVIVSGAVLSIGGVEG